MDKNNYKYLYEQLKIEFDEFAYIISHDFKAPLRAISNISEWIEEDLSDNIDPEIVSNLKTLKERVQRMDGMVDALTRYSRVNRRQLEIVEVNCHEIILEIIEFINDKYKTVKIKLEGDAPIIVTYKQKLQKVLEEIILNAAEHNTDKSLLEITISIKEFQNHIKFKITDNGKGISKNVQNHIFKMFYSEKNKEKPKAIGEGLAIVKKIVDFVGGNIEVDNDNNKLTLIVNWPKQK